MTCITIEVHNEEDRQLIQSLLKRMGIANIKEVKEVTEVGVSDNGKEVAALMRQLAEGGGISAIKDPDAWQKEIRTDRNLPFITR